MFITNYNCFFTSLNIIVINITNYEQVCMNTVNILYKGNGTYYMDNMINRTYGPYEYVHMMYDTMGTAQVNK